MSKCTTSNISLLLAGNVGLADRAKKSQKGLQGVQRIVRWMADIMMQIAHHGKKLACGRVSSTKLLEFTVDKLKISPTKLCERTLSSETCPVVTASDYPVPHQRYYDPIPPLPINHDWIVWSIGIS